MPKQLYPWVLYALLALLIAGCGGTTSPDDDNNDGTGNPSVRFGARDGAGNFVAHAINASDDDLIAGDSATLSVTLTGANGSAVTKPVDISFTSPCARNGNATIAPAITTATNGHAEVEYTAHGCNGPDTITASAVVGEATLNASVTLKTHAAPPASITFQKAQPSQIGLTGSGGTLPEQSVITFKLTNASGRPASGKAVKFRLTTQKGGISLFPKENTTDPQGLVSTTVTSGSLPASVRVIAQTTTNAGATLTAASSALAITTGLADNNSFTLSAETLNIEGWRYSGVETELIVLLADRFNNPVPDGTAVTFTAEGGAVEASCLTVDGQCAVTFRSQQPHPADGRVTILATATGEESFTDSNGDGRYGYKGPPQRKLETFADLAEAFRDDNENGTRQTSEPFVDFDNNQAYTLRNHRFNGILCDRHCAKKDTVTVRDSLVIVLSGSLLSVTVNPAPIILNGDIETITVTVSDNRNQVAPQGTTIAVEASQGKLIGSTQLTQENTNTPVVKNGPSGHFTFKLKPSPENGSGVFRVTVTTPKGNTTRTAVNITQTGAP